MFDDKFGAGTEAKKGNERELIILVDKQQNKEAHIVVSPFESFEDAITTAKRINEGLFKGEWNLYYLDPQTLQPITLDREDILESAFQKDIDTFYWSKKRANQGRQKFKKQRKNDFIVEVETGSTFENSSQKARKKKKRFSGRREAYQRHYQAATLQRGRYADVSKRALALMVDVAIIGVIGGMLNLSFPFWIMSWLYFALFESSQYQATLGKQLFNIKVTDESGNKLSFGKAFVRNLIKAATLSVPILLLVPFFSNRKQALHDLLPKTVVVKDLSTFMA